MTCGPVMKQGGKGMLIQHLVGGYVGYITNFNNGNVTNGAYIFTDGLPTAIF